MEAASISQPRPPAGQRFAKAFSANLLWIVLGTALVLLFIGNPQRTANNVVDGLSIGQPPYLSVISLELARRILDGKYPKRDLKVPLAPLTSDQVKVGETVFPDQPDSFFADFTDGGPHPILKLCVDAALNGTPCPGTLEVNLPPA